MKSLGITLSYVAILAILTFASAFGGNETAGEDLARLAISLLIGIPLIWATTAIALKKNRNGWAWGAIAVLLPLISLIVVAFMRKLDAQ